MKTFCSATGLLAAGVLIAASIFNYPALSAGPTDVLKDELDEFQMELTRCAAYYAIASGCMAKSGQTDLSTKSDLAYKHLMPLIYQTGNTMGLNEKAMLGRLQMSLDSMESNMAKDCGNLAAIYKYAMSCKSTVEHPDDRLRALLKGK